MPFVVAENNTNPKQASIIIAARNESKCIRSCIERILENELSGSNIEIIIIDDQSTDDTFEIVENIQSDLVSIHRLPDGKIGKKNAISYGVSKAKYPIILCTDADCLVGKFWIASHLQAYNDSSVQMATSIVMPVNKKSILGNFQSFDFAATMVITAVGIQTKKLYLANGANMSFYRDTFLRLNVYQENKHLASGDDIFLIKHVAKEYPNGVRFIKSKDSVVKTLPEISWTELVIQRIRWASKSLDVKSNSIMSLQGFIFLYTAFIGCLFLMYFYDGTAFYSYAIAGLVITKYITDYIFLKSVSRTFDPTISMKYFPFCFLLYFIHILGSGLTALFPYKYIWKGRTVR